ncbi:MAG: BadF/BadG/BcrA/BcrD ATPase family protein [Victivallaceae bacterium]|nr:BadF/BadG/BcrA/BcrD ATPase family protein [Victivallaceae bacterium]
MSKAINESARNAEKLYLGIDIGSTTFKAVLLTDRGRVRHSVYQRTKPAESGRVHCSGRCTGCGACNFGALRQTVDKFLADAGVDGFDDITCTVVTGSQIVDETVKFLPYDFRVSEVTAHVAGARHYYPDCKAILVVGGQDSKAMVFNEHMRMWNYKMSGICAAGTGAFLDSVAAKLNVPVEEMSDRVNYDSDLEFSSVCAVLSATSINKFKNRFPLGEIIAGACRAQARTIMSGVGELFFGFKGDIIFQGGVAYNRAVAYYLKEITGNNIIIPEFHSVMGALGAACLAREFVSLRTRINTEGLQPAPVRKLQSVALRALSNKRDLLGRGTGAPLIWRNLFFPPEILNAMGARIMTLETYAALFARNHHKVKHAFDNAACKGFSGETCSFLRVLEGVPLPEPAYGVSTSQPCQQGERVFRDLARSYGIEDRFFSLNTPFSDIGNSLEHVAEDLERSVTMMEKSTGLKMDMAKLREACELSNEARYYASKCAELRFQSPPLLRGSQAIYFAGIFSQQWGRRELVEIEKTFHRELMEIREEIGDKVKVEDTHRLLWLHLPPFYNQELLDYVELTCHAPIVFEEVNAVEWGELDVSDPYRSLARKLLTVGFMDPSLRVKSIIKRSHEAKFNGCLLYNHGFGRCSMADSSFIKHLREELNKEAIPLLVIDGDCVDQTVDPCSTYTKVTAYVEALNQKKFGNIFGPLR